MLCTSSLRWYVQTVPLVYLFEVHVTPPLAAYFFPTQPLMELVVKERNKHSSTPGCRSAANEIEYSSCQSERGYHL